MLDACAPKARWCDVFCEQGAFGPDSAREILKAGRAHGLGLRMHANQLSHGPGVQLAVEMGAASTDHCTHLDGADVDALAGSDTVATLLPGAEFSTRSPYPDARRLLDSGVAVALATDCNPGTSYTTSMPFVIALAGTEMHMTPDEALFAGALAGRSGRISTWLPDLGALRPGLAATSSCWTLRAQRISPTVPASPSSPPWSVQAGCWVRRSPGSRAGGAQGASRTATTRL